MPPQDPDTNRPEQVSRSGLFQRFLSFVEWLGNLLPHPVTLFALFCLAIIVISGIAGYLELSVLDPRPEGAKGRSATGTIEAVSLVNGEGLRRIVLGLVTNFTGFAPLGTVLVALLGVGVAEASGLLSAGIRLLVLRAPRNLVTFAIVLAAVLSNTASEMGYVVLIPLAAVVYPIVVADQVPEPAVMGNARGDATLGEVCPKDVRATAVALDYVVLPRIACRRYAKAPVVR